MLSIDLISKPCSYYIPSLEVPMLFSDNPDFHHWKLCYWNMFVQALVLILCLTLATGRAGIAYILLLDNYFCFILCSCVADLNTVSSPGNARHNMGMTLFRLAWDHALHAQCNLFWPQMSIRYDRCQFCFWLWGVLWPIRRECVRVKHRCDKGLPADVTRCHHLCIISTASSMLVQHWHPLFL